MNPIAHNIPIGELIAALTDMMLRGNKYVDVAIDDDYILRLKGLKRVSEKKRKGKKDINNDMPPTAGDIELMDLI